MATSPVLAIMGPTGIGKTDLAMALQNQAGVPVDLISVDSVMIYKDCCIGAAKPSKQLLSQHPHHLIDVCEHFESYDVAQFLSDAKQCIKESHQKGHLPCLVGGTMMYFHAAKTGIAPMPHTHPDDHQRIQKEAQLKGWPALWQRLYEIDPTSAQRIDPNDSQRIERALSVYAREGKTLTEYWMHQNTAPLSNEHWQWIALKPKNRQDLYQNLEKRFEIMLGKGLMEEVSHIRSKPETTCAGIRRAVGYRQIWDHLDGTIDYATMMDKAKVATRRLAKRQLTWINNQFQDAYHIEIDALEKQPLNNALKKLLLDVR